MTYNDPDCEGLSPLEKCLLHNFRPSLILDERGKILPAAQRIANLRAGRNLLRDVEGENLKKIKANQEPRAAKIKNNKQNRHRKQLKTYKN